MEETSSICLCLKFDAIKINKKRTHWVAPLLFFEKKDNPINCEIDLGSVLVLVCLFLRLFFLWQVKQLGNKSVSWVRVRDDHILSVDR